MRKTTIAALGVLELVLTPRLLSAKTVTTSPDAYFDPPASGDYRDAFRVVDSLTPVDWSWGRLELLEGFQKYRTEGYNLRTQKTRLQDTWQDEEYPLRTYYGELNQELVEAFNLYYNDDCVTAPSDIQCPDPGPTRPEARFALLHVGPSTHEGICDATRTPVLLVHGAMQNANVWLYPNGNDGNGNPYPGTTQLEGFVQTLERNGYCTFATTFGNFHGDNFSQAINLSNAIDRIKQITGQSKVDVVGWSKGVVSIDTYLSNPADWDDWSEDYFEQIAQRQAEAVPPFANDIRTYVSLSGPHKGIDLNWRHPYDDLLIFSTAENAPIGMGPVTWGEMSAIQCVTWGYYDSPDDPWWPDPYAYSVCEERGATWPDFFSKIYTSNIVELDEGGHPVYDRSLKSLNTLQGATDFSFDQYNMALWGAVDESGRYRNAYLGQLQVTNDLRKYHPVDVPAQWEYDALSWYPLDSDYYNWWLWLELKLDYNPYSAQPAGWVDSSFRNCRETAFEPDVYPCLATHTYLKYRNAESVTAGYGTYKLMDGIGINAAMRMGGNFVKHLEAHSLSTGLDYLYVLHGVSLGPEGYNFEFDAMSCSDCDPHGDAVLFEESIGQEAYDQLTQGWGADQKSCRSDIDPLNYSHLEVGTEAAVWTQIINKFKEVDSLSCKGMFRQADRKADAARRAIVGERAKRLR